LPEICEFVKSWNQEYEWPKFVIASTSDAFSAFEQRYGSELPQCKGDLTPYWEDGAGSSALETRMNRVAADRLTQAEALTTMLAPALRWP
jgi:alpha-mannosidase